MKLISLNIEGDKHLRQVISFLQKEKPDVICLQEVYEKDIPILSLGKQTTFIPMGKNKNIVGVALVSSLPHDSTHHFYVGEGTIPSHHAANDVDRVLVKARIYSGTKIFTIATTHFTWSADGKTTSQQLADLARLLSFLQEEMILCGDFNAPRGDQIYQELLKHFKDNIPANVTTTLDPQLHRAGPLPYVVDYLWTTPTYLVRNIKLVPGVSDHQAIVAEIE